MVIFFTLFHTYYCSYEILRVRSGAISGLLLSCYCLLASNVLGPISFSLTDTHRGTSVSVTCLMLVMVEFAK